MAFESKFALLDPNTQQLILDYAASDGAWKAAEKYYELAGMTMQGLYRSLKNKVIRQIKADEKELESENSTPKSKTKNAEPKTERKLSKDEKAFLKALESGTAGLEEASRFVAVRVFEKMLKNPDNFHYVDFFRTELLKLKQQENTDRNNYATELMNRMFGGYLPPRICPSCGHELIKLSTVVKGEVIHESLPATSNS